MTFRSVIISVLVLSSLAGCSRDPEPDSRATWIFPENALRAYQKESDSLSRQQIFLLYRIDNIYQDTLWFKPHTQSNWAHLFQIQAPESPHVAQHMRLSCPGTDGHVEIQSRHARIGQAIKLKLADSTGQNDFFRIIDRRSGPKNGADPKVYQGRDVDMEILGLRLYRQDTIRDIFSGHIALKFSGQFQSRKEGSMHHVEGYLGAW
jgi:hypothetical protein